MDLESLKKFKEKKFSMLELNLPWKLVDKCDSSLLTEYTTLTLPLKINFAPLYTDSLKHSYMVYIYK